MQRVSERERQRERTERKKQQQSIKHERIKIKDVRRVFSNSGSWHSFSFYYYFGISVAVVVVLLRFFSCFFRAAFSLFFSSLPLLFPSFQFFWCIRSSRAGIHLLRPRNSIYPLHLTLCMAFFLSASLLLLVLFCAIFTFFSILHTPKLEWTEQFWK